MSLKDFNQPDMWISANYPYYGFTTKLYVALSKPRSVAIERRSDSSFTLKLNPESGITQKVYTIKNRKQATASFQSRLVSVLHGRYTITAIEGDRIVFEKTERLYTVKDSK